MKLIVEFSFIFIN